MISTDRLSLRQVKNEDQDFIITFLADEKLSEFLPLERPYNEDEALKWFDGRLDHWRQHDFGTFAIVLTLSNEVVGYCGIEYVRDTQYIDIRYGLTKVYWSYGYAFEAASAVLQYGFNVLGIKKLYGAAVPQNSPSIRLLQKLGMSGDSTFKVYGEEVLHYSVSREQFAQSTIKPDF